MEKIKEKNMQNLFSNPVDIIPFIDLTSLNQDDNEESIAALCKKAVTPYGSVAAVCVYLPFVELAAHLLKHTSINIATVVNFPHGESKLSEILQDIQNAIRYQANEIDMVFPYRDYLSGNKVKALESVAAARQLCDKHIKLKIIIETGELKSFELIKSISTELIDLGVDFIKTSTGKVEHGASLEAAKAILTAIHLKNNHLTGIKISGGIRTISQAQSYIQLARDFMGENWINPSVFRIGASHLINEILDN
jgi:deoxyribose-phosphate aldolase